LEQRSGGGLEVVDLDRIRVMPAINAACPIRLAVNDGQQEVIVAATIGLEQALWGERGLTVPVLPMQRGRVFVSIGERFRTP
jgi:hypothetical protein